MVAYLDSSVSNLLNSRRVVPPTRRWRHPATGRAIRIGLVNNMPDGALVATERQFAGLIETATQGQVRVGLYYLPGLARGEDARKVLAARYSPVSELYAAGVDALIITGNEPRAPRLNDEPYWPELTGLIGWARDNTATTLLSCLAAHAAVLHLDGIERRRLPEKRSGVYACKVASENLPLPANLSICHSRLNEVPKRDLLRHGYTIISDSDGGHVDAFTKSWTSAFLFLQGHPEYDPESLAREYRRDVGRFLNGQRKDYPGLPENYFDAPSVRLFEAFKSAAEDQALPVLMDRFPTGNVRQGLAGRLARSAVAVTGFWLDNVLELLEAR